VLLDGGDGLTVPRLKSRQKGLGLAPQVVEIRTCWKLHGAFSMRFARVRSRAARRT